MLLSFALRRALPAILILTVSPSAVAQPPSHAPVAATTPAARSSSRFAGVFRGLLPGPFVAPRPALPPGQGGTPPQATSAPAPCEQDDTKSDCRENFEASFFLGAVIDNFSGSEVQQYLNPQSSNRIQARGVGGIDFGYRLYGDQKPITAGKWRPQLWIYGETVHGARSSDIDCNTHAVFCQTVTSLGSASVANFEYILRNASSLEGFFGLRGEFWTLQPASEAPANLYFKLQAGFLSTTDHPDDSADIHHVGLGALITKGDFAGTYLEVGHGRTDLFSRKRKQRWKVDGHLNFWVRKGISFFTQINVDSDVGKGSDSFQTYLGFNFSFRAKDWFADK